MALIRNDEEVGAALATGKAQTSYVLQATQDPGENDIQAVDLEGLTALIAAAQTADVSHFTYTSLSGNVEPDCPLRDAKRAVDQRLKESALVYTVPRPGSGAQSRMSTSTYTTMLGFLSWKRACASALFYNHERLHQSLGYQTPAEVHHAQKQAVRC